MFRLLFLSATAKSWAVEQRTAVITYIFNQHCSAYCGARVNDVMFSHSNIQYTISAVVLRSSEKL